MSVSWKPSTEEAHNALPKKSYAKKDPGWESLMEELERGNTVMVEYHDDKEKGTLSRSLGRRASHRGFKVDIRNGDGYISVRQAEEPVAGKGRRRQPKDS